MRDKGLAQKYINAGRVGDDKFYELLKVILSYRADAKDAEINHSLLRKLVLDYSNAERNLFELNQLKNKFLGMAAHDLRNPLASIRGFSEIILSGDVGSLTEEQKEFLTIINSLSQDMLTLVNDLLDVSVIESGKLDLKLEPGSLKELIEERVRVNSILANQKMMKLHTSLSDVPKVSFDSIRIAQVIDNLITNAIKYSPPHANIYITLQQKEGKVTMGVRDQGPGISLEEQPKLFGEFQRLSTQPTGGEKSTGLGLAIAHKIVTAHNGTIGVESQVGSGSTFTFSLPIGDLP